MELVAQQGLDNAQLLYAGKTVTTLTDGVALGPISKEPTVIRVFTTQPGLKLSINMTPDITLAFTLVEGENIWGVPGNAQVCIYGGDAEIMY